MASGITTAQQLQDVLDSIHNNISQMDVYQGLSELGSLRLCWNDISRTATIFKRINEKEEREEVVCTFNPENIVIGTDTFQGKMLKNIVHNATTTVTRSNDVGLGGYVGLKTLIRNICAALGVNLASNFDEINPTIYGELVNIVKKYYGDSLQNNAPYGIARKDTTSGGTTTTTYNSYIPVMIIVDIAIYLNGLGLFVVNDKALYQPLHLPIKYLSSTTDINRFSTIEHLNFYYDFITDKSEFMDFCKVFTESFEGYKDIVNNSIRLLFEHFGSDISFENNIACLKISGIRELTLKVYPSNIKAYCIGNNLSAAIRNGAMLNNDLCVYYEGDTYYSIFTLQYDSNTSEYIFNKTVTEVSAGTISTISLIGVKNIKCNRYIKPYYVRYSSYPNNFRTDDDFHTGSTSAYVFVDNYTHLSVSDFADVKLLNMEYSFRLYDNTYIYTALKSNDVSFNDTDLVINFNCHSSAGAGHRIYVIHNVDKLKINRNISDYEYSTAQLGSPLYMVCRQNKNGSLYTLYNKPYVSVVNVSTSSEMSFYYFDSVKSIDYYDLVWDNNTTSFKIVNTGNYSADSLTVDTNMTNYHNVNSFRLEAVNIGELVEIVETSEPDGVTLQDNATYPSAVNDYTTFVETYPAWGKIGYSQPYFEEDQIAGTYTAQWAAISVDTDTPTSQADSQAGEIDFTDTDLIDDIIDDIDNADDGNDEEEVDPNSDEIEGEGETPDDELDRIEPNVLTGGFVKQYALTDAQMKELATCLTNPDLLQTVVRAFRDPMKAIVSLQLAYKTPKLTSPTDIILYGFDWSSLTNKPKGYPLATNIINFDFGTIHIDPLYNTYQDITTTSIELYLPCVGFIPLNPAEFLDRGLDVEGKIDTLSGTVVYDISAYDGTKRKLIYQKTGNCQLQLPISSNDNSTIFGALMGVGGMALGGFTGNPLLMAQGAATTGATLAQGPNYEHGGSISANAGLMTKMIPCVIIKRNQVYNPTHLNELHGLPANSYVKLGSCSGYTVVQDVKVDIQGATQSEKSQIETLLKGGVIL